MIDRPAASVLEDVELTLVLPDGATRTVPAGTLPVDVVRSIGERLLSAANALDEVIQPVGPRPVGRRFPK